MFVQKPHVIIISPYTELSTTPCVYEFIKYLESEQIKITLFGPGEACRLLGRPVPSTTSLYGNFPNWRPHGVSRLLSDDLYISLFALAKHKKNKWTVIIALDAKGLGHAQVLNRFLNLPLWYWSLELYFESDGARQNPAIKKSMMFEKHYLPGCDGIIIQDQSRYDALLAENPFVRNLPAILMSNSGAGSAVRSPKRLFHERFQLAEKTRVVLYSGSFSASNLIDDVALSVGNWPDDWVLIINSRFNIYGDGNLAFAANLLKKVCPPSRIYFMPNPSGYDELPDLIASADVGVALYDDDPVLALAGLNNKLMGHASGKINAYLKAGLPIIVNQYTNVAEWVTSSECGIVVESTNDIGRALSTISERYTKYSDNALKYFNNHLKIDVKLRELFEAITCK